MTWGRHEESLKEQYSKTGRMPQALQNKPDIPYWCREYFQAFLSLSRHRQVNQVEQALSVSDIIAYGREFGFEGEEMESFLDIIGRLDQMYLTHSADKRKQHIEEEKRKQKQKR